MYSVDDYSALSRVLPYPVAWTVQPPLSLDTVFSAANPRTSPNGPGCIFADLLADPFPADPFQQATRGDLRATIDHLLADLDPRSRAVLRLRFGLDDGCSRTLEEIGAHFGLTRERIRQIEQKALSRLRSHPVASMLEPWLRDRPGRPAPREWPPPNDAPCPIRARRSTSKPGPPLPAAADETAPPALSPPAPGPVPAAGSDAPEAVSDARGLPCSFAQTSHDLMECAEPPSPAFHRDAPSPSA